MRRQLTFDEKIAMLTSTNRVRRCQVFKPIMRAAHHEFARMVQLGQNVLHLAVEAKRSRFVHDMFAFLPPDESAAKPALGAAGRLRFGRGLAKNDQFTHAGSKFTDDEMVRLEHAQYRLLTTQDYTGANPFMFAIANRQDKLATIVLRKAVTLTKSAADRAAPQAPSISKGGSSAPVDSLVTRVVMQRNEAHMNAFSVAIEMRSEVALKLVHAEGVDSKSCAIRSDASALPFVDRDLIIIRPRARRQRARSQLEYDAVDASHRV